MNSLDTRRAFIRSSAAIGTGLFLSACGRSDSAVKQIGEIEGMLGLTDISQFTAPPPPKA